MDENYPQIPPTSQFFKDNPEAQFLMGDGVIFREDGKRRHFHCQPGKVDREVLSRCDPLQQPSTFWRRAIHSEIGFIDESLSFTMDWDFFMRVAMKYEMHYLPISFSRYRIHGAQKTGSGAERRSQEILEFIEKYANSSVVDVFRATFPYAHEISSLRTQFGWRLGRVAFYVKHPSLVFQYGKNLKVALNMYSGSRI